MNGHEGIKGDPAQSQTGKKTEDATPDHHGEGACFSVEETGDQIPQDAAEEEIGERRQKMRRGKNSDDTYRQKNDRQQ